MSDEQIKTIRILLDRMDRGALLDAERELLRTLVLQVIDLTREIRQLAENMQGRAKALTHFEKAEKALTHVRTVAGWAALSWTDLTPEKVFAALGDGLPAEGVCTCRRDTMCASCSGLDT